jgi:hypothetical protein
MFDFFKRSSSNGTAKAPRASAKPRSASSEGRNFDPLAPLPTPEVKEGNDDSDWSLWEDSVAFQDSQMPGQYTETRPTPIHGADAGDSVISTAFDTVRKDDL